MQKLFHEIKSKTTYEIFGKMFDNFQDAQNYRCEKFTSLPRSEELKEIFGYFTSLDKYLSNKNKDYVLECPIPCSFAPLIARINNIDIENAETIGVQVWGEIDSGGDGSSYEKIFEFDVTDIFVANDMFNISDEKYKKYLDFKSKVKIFEVNSTRTEVLL